MNHSHTIGAWTRIGHGEDAWVGEPEFGMDLVFTVKMNGEQWRDKGQREDVQFPSVYTRPTSTRPRRIASVNHRILQNECVSKHHMHDWAFANEGVQQLFDKISHRCSTLFWRALQSFACLWDASGGRVRCGVIVTIRASSNLP